MSEIDRIFEDRPNYLPKEEPDTDALQPRRWTDMVGSRKNQPQSESEQSQPTPDDEPRRAEAQPEQDASQDTALPVTQPTPPPFPQSRASAPQPVHQHHTQQPTPQQMPQPQPQWQHQPVQHQPGPQPDASIPTPAPRTHEVADLIQQLQRPPEVPVTGWRKLFRLKPSKAAEELAADERLLRTGFVRPVVIMVANPKGGVGKALSVHEPVLTPDGYRPIGELDPGDLVVGRDGLSHEVLGVYPQGERDLFKITFDDGTHVIADSEHLWEVGHDGQNHVVTTQTMIDEGADQFTVAVCEPIKGNLGRHGDAQSRAAFVNKLLADSDVPGVIITGDDALAYDVEFAVETLGCVVHRVTTESHHTLHIKPHPNAGLSIPHMKKPCRAITSIEPVGRGEAVCIAVSSPDHLFLTRNCVPTHNTPMSIGLSAAFGDARGGGVVGWDNNELRGTMGDRTYGSHSQDVVDMIQNRNALLEATTRAADVHSGLHYQHNGQFWVLRSSQVAGHQITDVDFSTIHEILARFFPVIIIDTGNNEAASNWLAAAEYADALVVPVKWRKDNLIPAARMLTTLSENGNDLVNRTVVVGTNGPNDAVQNVKTVAKEWFRGYPVLDVPTDNHIAEGAEMDWALLNKATRRAYQRIGAVTAGVIADYLNGEDRKPKR